MIIYAFLKVLEVVRGWLYAPKEVYAPHEEQGEQEEEEQEQEVEEQEEQGPVKRYNLRERKLVDYQE